VVAGDSSIFEATVRSGRISNRMWRVLGAVGLFVLMTVITDPWANWPLGVAVLAAATALRWWQHRSWDGAAVFLLQSREAEDGEFKGILLLRPALELLPESMSCLRLEVVDRRGRGRAVWQDSSPVDPSTAVDAVRVSFEAPLSSRGQRARWVVSLEANTARGKLTIEAQIPATTASKDEGDDL
jgi:hypothetical protein